MSDIVDIVNIYVTAWHEEDEEARSRLLEAAWSEDGIYQDPNADISGRENLSRHIASFHKRFPRCRFVLPSGVDYHHGFAHFAWRMVGPDGETVLTGRDFAALDETGRICRITGFFDMPPRQSA